ncbi:protein of unknown function [Azospirillum baldaniorum]|uniref:Uncharacterized protein n=1 Tax=Azospirillum baldaniorum TaxID=1064539 RepID=A0A9P1JTF9_9PROT|nr:protein of unknown function [Azospirillum baldaniorum]
MPAAGLFAGVFYGPERIEPHTPALTVRSPPSSARLVPAGVLAGEGFKSPLGQSKRTQVSAGKITSSVGYLLSQVRRGMPSPLSP